MPYHREQKRHEIARLTDRIADAVYTPLADLQVTAWRTKEPVPFAERESGERLDLRPGDPWGELFDCAWFHFVGRVPEAAAGKRVVLLIDVNGEACVVDGEGNPTLGLTCVNSEYDYSLGKPGKRVAPLTECAEGGEVIDLWADAGCNDLFGRLHPAGTLKEARIAVLNPELHALSYDWEVLHDLMLQLPENSARRHRIWGALCRAALVLSKFDDDEARAARRILAPELAKRGGDPSLTITAVGHSHIDLAWLWPIRETIRKGARTFATVLHNMERYPEYVFGASQPQLYQWVKDRYPSLYEKVKRRIEEGRWEVQGAMWVEADTNLPGGESLVRQMLYGKRFFRAEFGKDVRNLWLPDVFGYSGSLPQLLKKAGVEIFMTQKLSWSLVNKYPHHTFQWQGIDGSRVLAHLPPEDTYNSSAAPHAIAKAENGFLDKEISEGCLLLFGIGDGGGGPGEEHLERLAREKNLAGLCPVVQEPAQRLFDRIAEEARRTRLPVWTGELYLERHQGTFTTQARNKRYNRKLELALREAELACMRAQWFAGRPYPSETFDRIWKEMLLYQFHDILPGSSITRVYTESLQRYAALMEQVEQLTADAEAALFAEGSGGVGPQAVVANSLSWERTGVVRVDGKWAHVSVPALGYAAIGPEAPTAGQGALRATESLLENDLLRVEFDADGSLRSVWDKENGREALQAGAAGNCLAVYEDPGDAWDFALDYDDRTPERFVLRSAAARVDGPQAIVQQVYAYGSSMLTQEVVLTTGSRVLEFRTTVDWRETERMLRSSFPVAVRADEATFEIQFGSLRRPTHCNTTWDLARFEVCAQKWVDISERAYGVALLNDCKYGHQVRENVIDIDLLRSPCSPDPTADRAVHQFTYALYPHAGDHVVGGVSRAAYELNVPLRVLEAPGTVDGRSFLTVDAPNVIVEAVKKAEDSDRIIVRLYEASGASVTARISLPEGASTAELVDLMEENPAALPVRDGAAELAFGPFEVHTLRIG